VSPAACAHGCESLPGRPRGFCLIAWAIDTAPELGPGELVELLPTIDRLAELDELLARLHELRGELPPALEALASAVAFPGPELVALRPELAERARALILRAVERLVALEHDLRPAA
jgi:hypothetical protein